MRPNCFKKETYILRKGLPSSQWQFLWRCVCCVWPQAPRLLLPSLSQPSPSAAPLYNARSMRLNLNTILLYTRTVHISTMHTNNTNISVQPSSNVFFITMVHYIKYNYEYNCLRVIHEFTNQHVYNIHIYHSAKFNKSIHLPFFIVYDPGLVPCRLLIGKNHTCFLILK